VRREVLYNILIESNLQINADKTKCMVMSRHPNSGKNHNIRVANESFEKVAKFKYFGTTLASQKGIYDEIKRKLIIFVGF
jgi:hypothetical protein